jgi:hypothetical protein
MLIPMSGERKRVAGESGLRAAVMEIAEGARDDVLVR